MFIMVDLSVIGLAMGGFKGSSLGSLGPPFLCMYQQTLTKLADTPALFKS